MFKHQGWQIIEKILRFPGITASQPEHTEIFLSDGLCDIPKGDQVVLWNRGWIT